MLSHDSPSIHSLRPPNLVGARPTRRAALGLGATALGTAALLGTGSASAATSAAPAPGAPHMTGTDGTGSDGGRTAAFSPGPVLVGRYPSTPALAARTEDGRLLAGRRGTDGAGWTLREVAAGLTGEPQASQDHGDRVRLAARTEEGLLIADETAGGSGEFEVTMLPDELDEDPAMIRGALFGTVKGTVVDFHSLEAIARGEPAEGPLDVALEPRLGSTDVVAVSGGPEGLQVVRRLGTEWSSFTTGRHLTAPRLSSYSMRGGVTTWILGREKGELVAGMLSSVGEEEIDWQLIGSDVVGGPAALHTDHNSRGNPVATVHGSGELHITGLTPNAPETRGSPLEAVGEPAIGGAYDGPLMTFAHAPDGTLRLDMEQSGGIETAQLAADTTGPVSLAEDAEGAMMFAAATTGGALLVGTFTGPGAEDWSFERVPAAA